MKRILVTIPNLHWIRAEVSAVTNRLLLDGRYSVSIKYPSSRPYVDNLHGIVEDLVTGPYDYWLNIDADNPPRMNPLDLVELDLDVVGLPTPVWHFTGGEKERPIYWTGYDWDEESGAFREHQTRDGLQRVDAIGTGCFLAARRVFEDNAELGSGAFYRTWNDKGRVVLGNDLAFCRRASACGVAIYCHYGYPCDHFAEVELNEVAKAYRSWQGAAQ